MGKSINKFRNCKVDYRKIYPTTSTKFNALNIKTMRKIELFDLTKGKKIT